MLSIFGARTRAFEESVSPAASPMTPCPPLPVALRRLSADVKVCVRRTAALLRPPALLEGGLFGQGE